MIIYGLHPVLEALRAGRVTRVRVSSRVDSRVREVLRLAADRGVSVETVPTTELDRVVRGEVHQGVVADIPAAPLHDVGGILAGATAAPLLVVLDGVEDPHNLGAILRVVDAAGADGVVRQTRHAAALDGVAAKASAGAITHVKVASVVNIARAIGELKEAHVWAIGLADDAHTEYTEVDLTLPTALVLGAEGAGMRRLVRESCDLLVSIPMLGHVESLNVSVAAGIVLYEAVRQRMNRARSGAARANMVSSGG